MTMAPDPDAEFLAMMEGQFEDMELPDEALDITQLSEFQLSELFNETRDALLASGEMDEDNPHTPEGRELHSVRAACLVEMSKRGMR